MTGTPVWWLVLADYLARHRKAVIGFVAPGVGIVVPAAIAGQLSWAVLWAALGACVLTSFGVGATPNRRQP